MRFLLVFIALSLVTISSGSEETDALHKAEYLRLVKAGESGKARLYIEAAYPQWDLKKMRGLCMFVSSREEEDNPVGRFKWTYQALILQAARANPETDSEEEMAAKIRPMWKTINDLGLLGCTKGLRQNKFDI
jgi:hypothetical protein